jgi:hypothetical protein
MGSAETSGLPAVLVSIALAVRAPMLARLEISDAVFGPSLSASRILGLFWPRGRPQRRSRV